jgi:ER-bound oxygenase mpaB/B'/Rubber oxygenase, catalytic domain
VTTSIVLPWPLRSGLEAATRTLFGLGDQSSADFLRPAGEAALVSPTQSWRVCKDPLSLFIGGVAAVIMELAEPRVRTGVWKHTTFRIDPIRRTAADRTCRYGHGLRRSRYGRGYDRPAFVECTIESRARRQQAKPTVPMAPELLNWIQMGARKFELPPNKPLSGSPRRYFHSIVLMVQILRITWKSRFNAEVPFSHVRGGRGWAAAAGCA